jgi:hypothetical protein
VLKKILPLCVYVLIAAPLSFGQIFRCDAEQKSGHTVIALHFLDYANYRYLLYTEDVNVFLDEANLAQLKAVLEKFKTWETLAQEEQMTLTKTIDSITFTSYYHSRTFFKEPAVFYFIFTGSQLDTNGAAPIAQYTLYIDTTLDKIAPFRLSSSMVQELLDAISPEKLTEAREAYEQQRALEELFN